MATAHLTLSLDGFMAGPDISPEHPMGRDGERLHEWIFAPTAADTAVIEEARAEIGAVVLGRRTFDVGLRHWQDTPYPVPSYVVTHRPEPPRVMKSGTFTFAPDLATAVDAAQESAGDKRVVLMGADITRQALAAGCVEELRLQIAPLLLGAGERLFTGTDQRQLEILSVVSSQVTHLHYRVVT